MLELGFLRGWVDGLHGMEGRINKRRTPGASFFMIREEKFSTTVLRTPSKYQIKR